MREILGQVPASRNRESVEVAVIGCGVAGLSGGLTLARARRSVIVIDEGHPHEHPLGIGTQIQTNPGGRAAPGVWVAGNLADGTSGVLQSAASGVTAAAALNADLIAEDTRLAITTNAVGSDLTARVQRAKSASSGL